MFVSSPRLAGVLPLDVQPIRDRDLLAACPVCGHSGGLSRAHMHFASDQTIYLCPEDGAELARVTRLESGRLAVVLHAAVTIWRS